MVASGLLITGLVQLWANVLYHLLCNGKHRLHTSYILCSVVWAGQEQAVVCRKPETKASGECAVGDCVHDACTQYVVYYMCACKYCLLCLRRPPLNNQGSTLKVWQQCHKCMYKYCCIRLAAVVSLFVPHLPQDPIGHGCGLSLEYETYQLRSQLGECKRREEKLNAIW